MDVAPEELPHLYSWVSVCTMRYVNKMLHVVHVIAFHCILV